MSTRRLNFQCPACSRKLAAVDGMQVATQVIRRKCGKCGKQWQVVIAPHEKPGMFLDVGTFAELKGERA